MIADCFVAAAFLYRFLSTKGLVDHLYSLDSKGNIERKVKKAIKFWSAVNKRDVVTAIELMESNQRTSKSTLKFWKKTLISQRSYIAKLSESGEDTNSKMLELIQNFEDHVQPHMKY